MALANKIPPILTRRDLEHWQDPKLFIDPKKITPNDDAPVLAILTDSETGEQCYQVVQYKNGFWHFLPDPAGRISVTKWIPLFPLNLSRP